MYKGASESLQRRYAVDKPHPSRGYIDGSSDARDILPEPENMTLPQAEAERDNLRQQILQLEQGLAVAKRARPKDIPTICDQKAVVQARLILVKERIKDINRATSGDTFRAAVKDIVDGETWERIIIRHMELRGAPASVIEARRAVNAEGGAVEDESTVAESETPNE